MDVTEKLRDDQWKLVLPLTKPLSMNDRYGNHYVKNRRVQEVREATGWLAKKAKIPHCERIKVTLVYEPRDKRRRDPLNLTATLKAAQDGIVDVGVVDDDTIDYVESPMPMIDAPTGTGKGKIWILVEKLR